MFKKVSFVIPEARQDSVCQPWLKVPPVPVHQHLCQWPLTFSMAQTFSYPRPLLTFYPQGWCMATDWPLSKIWVVDSATCLQTLLSMQTHWTIKANLPMPWNQPPPWGKITSPRDQKVFMTPTSTTMTMTTTSWTAIIITVKDRRGNPEANHLVSKTALFS